MHLYILIYCRRYFSTNKKIKYPFLSTSIPKKQPPKKKIPALPYIYIIRSIASFSKLKTFSSLSNPINKNKTGFTPKHPKSVKTQNQSKNPREPFSKKNKSACHSHLPQKKKLKHNRNYSVAKL